MRFSSWTVSSSFLAVRLPLPDERHQLVPLLLRERTPLDLELEVAGSLQPVGDVSDLVLVHDQPPPPESESPVGRGPVVAQTSSQLLRMAMRSDPFERPETRVCKRDSSSRVVSRRPRRHAFVMRGSRVRIPSPALRKPRLRRGFLLEPTLARGQRATFGATLLARRMDLPTRICSRPSR
jgi:hypothetical protein